MCCCYILHSNKLDKYYVGVTCENLEDRIKKHNNWSYGSHRYTAVSNDWRLFLPMMQKSIVKRFGWSEKSSQ